VEFEENEDMRGLRLFVRPIEPTDGPAIARFLGDHVGLGLLGKLLGDIVAVVALEITEDALRVDRILVAPELRRKWIGKAMMREVEQLAAKFDRRRIIVDDACGAQEFFRRVGFQSEGERWVRDV
jgi:GNAT superfamily N-acetyltransferase